MTKKNKKQEEIFTPSGYQADKDLMKVSVKVSPALQAIIANQIDLLEMLDGKAANNNVLIEQHRVELLQVEEEIANAFSNHEQKKEKARERRLLKKSNTAVPFTLDEGPAPDTEQNVSAKPVSDLKSGEIQVRDDDRPLAYDIFFELDPGREAPGLPSAKYATDQQPRIVRDKVVDVRLVALGASIKALQSFLGRELKEDELQTLENQVDAYLT